MQIPFIPSCNVYDNVIKQLSNDRWNKLTFQNRINLLKAVFLYEKELLFQNRKFDIALEISSELKEKTSGIYDKSCRKIYINENDFYKSDMGYDIYKTLIHELYHSYQDLLLINTISNKNEKIDILNFYQNEINKKFLFLNFNDKGNFHINKYDSFYFSAINNLSDIFYHLNLSERQAFEYQYNKAKSVLNNDVNNINYTDFYIQQFNIVYKTFLEKEQICKIIDDCFYMLSQNLQPETDLEASVMYDICCLALLENNKVTEIECNKMLQNSYKKVQLAEYGYCLNEDDRYGKYVITNGLKNKAKEYSSSKQEFEKLTPFEQQDNPYIILLSIVNLQEEIKDDILKSTLDPLFTYANAKQEYLYPDAQKKLLEWYPEKYHEYLDDFEL